MTPRGILTTIGATALGIGVVFGGASTIPNVLAQDAPGASEAPAQAQAANPDARFAEAYDSFVAALASELNADDAAVDAAIRMALKEQVAALESDGRLDAERVAELQAMIDESEAPLGLGLGGPGGFGGRGGMHGFSGHEGGFEGRGEHRGPRGGFDGRDDDKSEQREGPASDSAPATLPAVDDADDQGVPDSPAEAEDGASA